MLVWIDLLQFELARGPLKISLEWEGLPFQFQTLLNCCFQYFPFLNLLWRPVNCKCIDNTNYIVFQVTLGSCVEYFVRQLCPLSASFLYFELLIIAYEVCFQF
jgi:hypothetical protein